MQMAWAILLIVITSGIATAAPQTPPVINESQKVEVREGDTWSAATVLKKEGRRYLVHYEGTDAATDEWVTLDRIRLPGAGGKGAPDAAKPQAPGAAEPAAKPAKPAAKPPVVWNVRSEVEVKWGGLYRKATIINKREEWYLVNYEKGPFEEWVEPWRIRKIGSTDDPIGHAQPNPTLRKGQPSDPPSPKPGPPPEPMGVAHDAAKAIESEDAPTTPADRSAVAEVILGGGDLGLPALAPDAELAPLKPLAKQSIALRGGSGGPFDKVSALLFAATKTGIAAAVHTDRANARNAVPRVERIDLVAGKSLDVAQIPVPVEPLDLSPDGTLLLACSNAFGSGGRARLDVWQIQGGTAKQVISFIPFDNRDAAQRDIHWARFIDSEHLLTVGSGAITAWEFRKAKAIWSAAATTISTPALSANCKYLATEINGNIVIAESATGKALAKIPVDSSPGLRLSFKPDGKQLAGVSPELLLIWDLSNGFLTDELTPVGTIGRTVDWVSDGYVLLDGQHLASLEKKLVIWTYAGASAGHAFNDRYWYAADRMGGNKSQVLAAAALPESQARQAAQNVVFENETVLRPGMRVSLEVNMPAEGQQPVINALTANLKHNGVTVAPGQPLKLIAKVEAGAEHELEIRPFGAPRSNSTMRVRDTNQSLVLQGPDGKTVWQRTTVISYPMMVWAKQNQTIEEALAERMKPNYLFFEKARIPAYIPKSRTGLGTSTLTTEGIKG